MALVVMTKHYSRIFALRQIKGADIPVLKDSARSRRPGC
jgi:hypothetical protein